MEKSYSELLKDPRWQKKRLKILERDSWRCRLCFSSVITLNVHHLKYTGMPWEAKDKELVTVCEHCHELIEKWSKADKWSPVLSHSSVPADRRFTNFIVYRVIEEIIHNEIFRSSVVNLFGFMRLQMDEIHKSYQTDTEEDLI